MSDLPKSKVCSRCLKRKKLNLFGKNPRMKLGVKSYCRACSAELQREWNEANRAPKKKAGRKKAGRKTTARKKTTRRR